ncbi:TPA: DUF1697 domain-containing protein [Streptococcus suis]
MMRYVLLLRGINVGGKNKVVMSKLKLLLQGLGYEQVTSYINSGNLFFTSDRSQIVLQEELVALFAEHYPFVAAFSLLNQEEYEQEVAHLPAWWQEDIARKDVLFYTDRSQKALIEDWVKHLNLGEEVIHFGQTALFWGKCNEGSYLQTAYHKKLANQAFYKSLTVRNHKTFAKLAEFLK